VLSSNADLLVDGQFFGFDQTISLDHLTVPAAARIPLFLRASVDFCWVLGQRNKTKCKEE